MASFAPQGVLSPSHKRLLRSWWRKVMAAHPRAHDFEEMTVPRTEKGVFGIPLTLSIVYACARISYYDGEVECFGVIPTIVAKCGSFLKNEGLRVEGIFRLSGSARRIRMLQTIFDSPDAYGARLDWHGYTVHDAANILKRFLNALPEPVIPVPFYRPFLDSMHTSHETPAAKVAMYRNLIESLPTVHQCLLLYLLDMLSLFATHKDYTRMDTPCLASVFAPGMLSHPDDRLKPQSYKETQRVIQYLVQHQACFAMPGSPATYDQNDGHEPACALSAAPALAIPPPDGTTKSPEPTTPRSSPLDTAAAPSTLPSYMHGMYCVPGGSFSGLALETLAHDDRVPARLTDSPCKLRRAKTAPSKRKFYGEHELPQTVHVSRGSSQRTHHSVGGEPTQRKRSLRRIEPREGEDESSARN